VRWMTGASEQAACERKWFQLLPFRSLLEPSQDCSILVASLESNVTYQVEHECQGGKWE
jgi:hypothetical protein